MQIIYILAEDSWVIATDASLGVDAQHTRLCDYIREHACVLWRVSVVFAGELSSLTDNQDVAALSVHVNPACRCVAHGHPQFHFDRLESHCWAARSPPKGAGETY